MPLYCRMLLLAAVGLSTLPAQTKSKAAPGAALPEKALVDDLVLQRELKHSDVKEIL